MRTDERRRRRVPKGTCDEFYFENIKKCCSCCCDVETDEPHAVVLFYRYLRSHGKQNVLDDSTTLNALKTSLENTMLDLDVRGKIRLSPEGINGTAAGKESRVKQFEREMKDTKGKFAILELQGVDFKRERVNVNANAFSEEYGRCKHIFESASVRIVDEVCPFEPASSSSKKKEEERLQIEQRLQPYRLTPSEWREAIQSSDDDVVVLDVRNSYESRMGRFVPEKTMCCPIRRFNQFKEWVEEKGGKAYIENKKVLAYCTGGVRCEKATAYLLSLNVTKEVSVLEGGIVAYARDIGGDGFVGKNYVFDARGCVDVSNNNNINNNNNLLSLTKCDGCKAPCIPHLARCASKVCHVILAACEECSKSSTSIYCCDTCKANKDGEKKRACKCDSYRSRELRCEIPAV
ncbi:unnamed protein product [Bathycoccus prasinos]